ncbi:hypothetical protein ACJMK2_010278 [Sinanodonta woodiana]|uniref:Eukaryotic translation initiation factor 2 subunit 2 n=1 Tax=Sinanodonta woodiana TaxID=1069815 RepID=A0ABD3VHX0_SINWO
MADDELLPFDPSLKKKKKKKKATFDLDALEVVDGEPAEPDTGKASDNTTEKYSKRTEEKVNDEPEPDTEKDKQDEDFSLDFSGMRKKKKKKKPFDLEEMKESLPDMSDAKESEEIPPEPEESIGAPPDDIDLDLPMKKKKKKKKAVDIDELVGEEEKTAEDDDLAEYSSKREDRLEGGGYTEGKTWFGSDRDYTYDELLKRVFDIIREKNPDMVTGEKKKIVMRPPQVLRAGARKTSFANFSEICRMLHRQPKHVLAFLLAELGTSGSVDGNNQLIIKGKFNQKQIENVLRRYIKEYVTCHTCKSPDTMLQKEERLFFLQCETCGSRCSVQSIKSGFQAVTGRRAALRAQ